MVSGRKVGARAVESVRKGGPSVVATVVVALLFSAVALRDLNGLLQGMRGSDGRSYTIGSLAGVTKWPGESVEQTRRVLGSWHQHGEESVTSLPPEPVDAHRVAGFQILIDAFLFAVAYTAAFWLFFASTRKRFADAAGAEMISKLARIGTTAIVFTFAADELENLAEWQVVNDGWQQLDAGVPADSLSINAWGQVLWAAAIGKWLLLLFGVLPVFFGLALWRFRDWRSSGEAGLLLAGLWRLRVPVLLVIAFAALLLGHEQMPDIIRSWSIEQLAWTLVALLLLIGALWATGRVLVGLPELPPGGGGPPQQPVATPAATEPTGDTAQSPWWPYLVALAAALVCVVLWLVDRFSSHDIGWGWAILAGGIGLIVLTSVVFRSLAPEPEDAERVPRGSSGDRLPQVLAAAAPIALGLAIVHASFAYTVYLDLWAWQAAALLAAALLGAIVGALLQTHFGSEDEGGGSSPLWVQPPVWAALFAAGALGVIARRIGTGELNPSLLVAVGLLLGMLGWALYYLLAPQPEPKPDSPDRVVATGVSIAAALATVLLFAAVVVNPWLTAAHLGGIAVLTGFLLALALAGALLVGSAVALPAPAGLRAIGFQRTPVLALLLLWLLIASALDRGGYHDARALTDPAPVAGMSINEAWACWLGKNKLAVSPAGRHCTDEHAGTIAGPGAAVPLLLVSTSGGGIRAAYWTALVLDCALEVDVPTATANEPCSQNARSSTWERSNAVFAMSGISGGSLGLAAYNAFLAEKTAATDPGWIPKRMNADSLSASVAWWLFVEAPRAFLRYHNKDDRAAILERGWERDWAKEAPAGAGLAAGFLRLQRDHPELPLLLLNGTSVADGCRFNTSILDAGLSAPKASSDAAERCRSTQPFDGVYLTDLRPDQIATPDRAALAGTRDLLDFRCDSRSDIPLSTAALLSARFPFVSPAGRVAQDCAGKKVSYVVDGGYLETSGASPLTETAERLLPLIQSRNRRASRCIVPFLIQIDNGEAGYHNLSARPGELNVPLKTVFAARGGRAAQARNEAALLFSQRFGNATITVAGSRKKLRDRYAHFNNYAHPGPQPPLGWTLSERSREDLRAQLGQPQNVNAMNEVRSWFTAAREGRLRCE